MARIRRNTPPAADPSMMDASDWPDWLLNPPNEHDPRAWLFSPSGITDAEAGHREHEQWRQRRNAWIDQHRPDLVSEFRSRPNYRPWLKLAQEEARRRARKNS